MYTLIHFLKYLPDEFSRKDLMAVVIKKGYSISYGDRMLEHGVLSKDIVRLDRGKYKKANDNDN